MSCRAFQSSGVMVCTACALEWDVGDPDPPKCRQAVACAVCEGQAADVTVGRFHLCNDPRCADVAKSWLGRQADGSTYWESEAVKSGGKAAGKYLESIGKYDLASLTPDQWEKFCGTMVSGFRVELRRLGALKAPPF